MFLLMRYADLSNGRRTAQPPPPPSEISVGDGVPSPATEGTDTQIIFTVSLDSPAQQTVTMDVNTADGTATAGQDYTAISGGTLEIAIGQSTGQIAVDITDDALYEASNQTFTVTITNALHGVSSLTITDGTGTGTIASDDALTIDTPSITSPTNGATDVDHVLTLTSSAFGTNEESPTETHAVSDWQIATDSGFSGIVYQSLDDSTNKTSITVPAGNLYGSETFYARVRHGGSTAGDSAWSATISFTTIAEAKWLLRDYTDGFAFSAIDATARVKDTGTPANEYDGSVSGLTALSNNSISGKWTRDEDGTWSFKSAGQLARHYDETYGWTYWFEGDQAVRLNTYPRDLTNAAWTKSNVTATLDQVGIDGVGNSATRLTATSANATVLQSITSTSNDRALSAFVKRITGSGTIEMTLDGGSTWSDITSSISGAYARIDISQTLADPEIGFRIVTSGDEIAVDGVQCENTRVTSPILGTPGSQVTRPVDNIYILLSALPFSATAGTVFVHCLAPFGTDDFRTLFQFDDGGNIHRIIGYQNNGSTDLIVRVFNDAGAAIVNETVASLSGDAQLTFAFADDDYAISYNGGSNITDSAGSLPTGQTHLRFTGATNDDGFNGYFYAFVYVPTRVVNGGVPTKWYVA